jgi:hypothetical protein
MASSRTTASSWVWPSRCAPTREAAAAPPTGPTRARAARLSGSPSRQNSAQWTSELHSSVRVSALRVCVVGRTGSAGAWHATRSARACVGDAGSCSCVGRGVHCDRLYVCRRRVNARARGRARYVNTDVRQNRATAARAQQSRPGGRRESVSARGETTFDGRPLGAGDPPRRSEMPRKNSCLSRLWGSPSSILPDRGHLVNQTYYAMQQQIRLSPCNRESESGGTRV